MYRIRELAARRALADVPIAMPVNILFAMPVYTTNASTTLGFNLLASIARLLGYQEGNVQSWESATRIFRPHIWSPGWNQVQLRAYIEGALVDHPWAIAELGNQTLRVRPFPGSGVLRDLTRPDYPQYEIVHFVGVVKSSNGHPALVLDEEEDRVLLPGSLRDALIAAGTRLLILDFSSASGADIDDATRLAEHVVGAGGPPVLIVSGWDNAAFEAYFYNLYASILHNQLLPETAQPPYFANIDVTLVYEHSGEDVLQFNRWMELLEQRIAALREAVDQQTARLQALRSLRMEARRKLLRSRADAFETALETSENELATRVTELQQEAERLGKDLAEARAMSWSHESEGAIPLSVVANDIPAAETQAEVLEKLYPQLVEEMSSDLYLESSRAPRVLNANFADPISGRVLAVRDGLVAGRDYDLLVDVGPKWNTIPSIVTGHSTFPEDALPMEQEGYAVQVTVVSDDFEPRLVSTMMWVPRQTGRSFPVMNGQRADHPGPVALRLRAPLLPMDNSASFLPARARLCLYYENNLLQSALITTTVVQTDEAVLDKDNVVDVDYALTGSFQEIDTRYATRAVAFTHEDEGNNHPVRLNFTLNDDGASGHRIIATYRSDTASEQRAPIQAPSLTGWVPYNPIGVRGILDDVRDELLNCFEGVRDNNGKDRDSFRNDLRHLAVLGSKLFKIVTGQVEAGDTLPRDWAKELRRRLAKTIVIQVARTAPAEYVFPWALVYEYPMPGPSYKFCKVVKEWSSLGERENEELRECCPFHTEEWHKENIYCPYGFWGLKHIIEQPPSPLRKRNNEYVLSDVEKSIQVGAYVNVAIGVTRDNKLDLKCLDAHLAELRKIPRVQLIPPGAGWELDTVRALLPAPSIVYFLCHGKKDKDPYLGIGLDSDDPRYKVYPDTIQDWADTEVSPNLAEWSQQRPFVFVNGCHTFDLKPDEVLSFVTAFTYAGASGMVGTEISVKLPLAVEVAKFLFTKMVGGMGVGQAMREMRWKLANKGNLLGLAYTLYALADLSIVVDER